MVFGKCGVGGVGDEVSAEAAVHRVQLMALCLGCFLSCQPGQGGSVRLCRAGELGRFRGRVRSS